MSTSTEHVIVSMVDLVNARLAGRFGGYYVSRPQPLQEAHALIRTWLGDAYDRSRTVWSIAIPGGRRIVRIARASDSPAALEVPRAGRQLDHKITS